MGASPTVATVEAKGGAWAKYEQDFRLYADQHWATEGYGAGNYDIVTVDYYDRAMIYYVWWARTGNATYLERANAIALAYRAYLEKWNYQVQAHDAQLDGVALHYLVTGDEASRTAIGRVADYYASATWLGYLNNRSNSSNRVQARVLQSYLLAWYLKAPSVKGNPWGMWLREGLTRVLSTQGTDGAYRFTVNCSYSQPFQVGLLNDVLVRYHGLYEPDSRILPSVQRSVDFLWTKMWLPTYKAFAYLEGTCSNVGARTPAPDLNNMIAGSFAWVGRTSGNTAYLTNADAVFSGGVYGANLTGAKQFNESYTSAFRYLGLRW
jgi:hypothetical protein